MTPADLAARLALAPYDGSCTVQRLTITDADDALTDLEAGCYDLLAELDAASDDSLVMVRVGAATVVPASKAAAKTGTVFAPGAPVPHVLAGTAIALHARLLTTGATGTLWVIRRPL